MTAIKQAQKGVSRTFASNFLLALIRRSSSARRSSNSCSFTRSSCAFFCYVSEIPSPHVLFSCVQQDWHHHNDICCTANLQNFHLVTVL